MTESLRMHVRLAKTGNQEACHYVLHHFKPLLLNLSKRHEVHMSQEDAFATACAYAVLAVQSYDLEADTNLAYHMKRFISNNMNRERYHHKMYNDKVKQTITDEQGCSSDLPINIDDPWVIRPDEALLREEEKEESRLMVAILRQFYDKAKPSHKKILDLRKEGLTIRDIAEEMHMSEGYVHKCIRQCWNHIQEKMQVYNGKRI